MGGPCPGLKSVPPFLNNGPAWSLPSLPCSTQAVSTSNGCRALALDARSRAGGAGGPCMARRVAVFLGLGSGLALAAPQAP